MTFLNVKNRHQNYCQDIAISGFVHSVFSYSYNCISNRSTFDFVFVVFEIS